ncbi:hypothetical protein ARMGADRAFT_1011671 [Armillaria gallica]|uniref:Uncharacterized protein n=1 Tax=Armillaria gallica TaxID=47427 RepID=A0A2H3E0A1_ARMGA|nr:hypothetical protein ARMGADRAFT_1011671 [Armillaria gallica]
MTDTPLTTDNLSKHLLTDATGAYDAWEFHMCISASQKLLLDTILGTNIEPTTGHNSKG